MITNREYWKIRFSDLNDRMIVLSNEKSQEYIKYVEGIYRDAYKDIEQEISVFAQRFRKANGISKQEARRLLKPEERKQFQMTLAEYMKRGKGQRLSQNTIRRLENASSVYQISRLEAMQYGLMMQAERLTAGVAAGASKALRELYREANLQTAYELQKGLGVSRAFSVPNATMIEKALARPWTKDGLDFSERVWGKYRPRLTHALETTFTKGIMQGKSTDRIIKEMAAQLGDSQKAVSRLVLTESAFIAQAAQQDCFSALEVEQYEILATLSNNTCEECGTRDKEVHNMADYQVGDTAPPFHPNCRCTTAPYFHDEFTQGEIRAARGEDGKTEYIPADTTYKEWKEQKEKQALESDSMADKARRAAKGAISGKELTAFEGLPETVQNRFRNGLQTADSMVRTVIERELQDLDFFVTDGKNVFNSRLNAIGIKLDASPSSIAHEIFHRMDKANGITKRYDFGKALQQDFERLQFLSKGNVTEYLKHEYPAAFDARHFSGLMKMNPEYRGISDIFSGLSKNEFHYGYWHKTDYWNENINRLPKEAWAQFGRMKFENNPEVLDMFEWLFPNFNDYATMALKELI